MHVEEVEGNPEAKEIETGESAGLSGMPFKDGRTIGEIGLRGFRIIRREEDEGPRARSRDAPREMKGAFDVYLYRFRLWMSGEPALRTTKYALRNLPALFGRSQTESV